MSGLDDDEESKQEETLTEAHRDGNMAFLGDCGGSQSVFLKKANFPKSQPAVLGKRENPEEGGDGDYNSLVASAITYIRYPRM